MLAEDKMNEPITQAPTGTTMILRALARFPERMAFVWDGGSLTYRATLDLIGRLQAAMAAAGLRQGADRGVPQRQQRRDLVRRRGGVSASAWSRPGCIRWARWAIISTSSRMPRPRR